MLQIRVQTVFSRQARQKLMEIYRQPMTPEQLLGHKTATDGITTRLSTSNKKGRLHVLVRPEGRVLRFGNRSRATRLPNRKRARSTLPARLPTDGQIAKPLPLLRVYGHIRVRHVRQPDPGGFTTYHGRPTHPDGNMPSKRYLPNTRWRGAKILSYIDDFLLFAATREPVLALRQRVDLPLTNLRLLRHPTKGLWEPN
jgi:hypothetical protein